MIKFFRRIRYDLMEKNPTSAKASAGSKTGIAEQRVRTGKYLKYAIGEVLLVVIGILIALQINNWNENRKAKIAEYELYKVILKDIELDDETIREDIKYFTEVQSMQYHVFQETKGLATYDSTVSYQLLRPLKLFSLVTKSNYAKKNVIIKNDSIKKQLELYFKMEDYVYDAITQIASFKDEHLRPAFSKYGIQDTQVFYDNHKLDYFELAEKNYINYSKLKQLYGTVELDQLLFNLGIKTSWVLQGLKLAQEEGEKLKSTLENALNSNK